MVNKVALGILAVIVLTAMTVGGLVGLQLSGDEEPDEATPTPTTTPTPTPASASDGSDGSDEGGDGESGDGESGDVTPTPTPEPTPTVSAAHYDATLIEEEVRVAINERRADRGMQRLAMDERIREMARNHSRTLSELGYVTHDAGGLTAADRYEAFDLDERCRVPDNSNSGIRRGRELETLDKKTFGENYTFASEDRTVTIENETTAARAAVDSWFTSEEQRRKLLLEAASAVGVGVTITDRGDLYVTVDLC